MARSGPDRGRRCRARPARARRLPRARHRGARGHPRRRRARVRARGEAHRDGRAGGAAADRRGAARRDPEGEPAHGRDPDAVHRRGRSGEGARPSRDARIPGRADPDTIARFIQALLEQRGARARRGGAASGSRRGPRGRRGQALADRAGRADRAVPREPQDRRDRAAPGRRTARRDRAHRAARRRPDPGARGQRHGREGAVPAARVAARPLRIPRAARHRARRDRAAHARAAARGQRQADEWERIASELPAPNARVALKVARSSLPGVLHPLTQEVLLVLELSSRVSDVLDRCSFPDYQVLRTLQTLIRRGMVELRAGAAAPEQPTGGVFGVALAARLRDWLDQGRPREAAAARCQGGVLRAAAARSARRLHVAARAPARRRAAPARAEARRLAAAAHPGRRRGRRSR